MDQELGEIHIEWTLQYLSYNIDDGLIAPTATEFIAAFLENDQETKEYTEEEGNTSYPASNYKYFCQIPAIWTYSRKNPPNQHNSIVSGPGGCLGDRQAEWHKLGTIPCVKQTVNTFGPDR